MGVPTVVAFIAICISSISCFDNYHPRLYKEHQYEKDALLGSEETENSFWNAKAQEMLGNKLQQTLNTNKAKNVILFLGDGMSVATLTASRIYQSELGGSRAGEGGSLSFEKFPYTGLSKTYCVDDIVPDSACTSTAYLGGVKGNYGTIGVNGKVDRDNCEAMMNPANHVESIAKWFQDSGLASGIVTTTRVTHASPAGAYAHTAERNWEDDSNIDHDGEDTELCDDIAEQLIYKDPGRNFNVILGGGRQGFLPKSKQGNRLDGVDLTDVWKNDKASLNQSYAYVTTRNELLSLSNTPKYLLGLFAMDHLAYHLEENTNQPSLAEMTQSAIKVLESTGKGFFLFVEGGKIDIAHHGNYAHMALDETVEFAKAIELAKSMTNASETLIVVTADHAHTMSISGYPTRLSSILGIAGKGTDGLPHAILNYANGPSYKQPKNNTRNDISKDDMSKYDYEFPAAVPLDSETHGGDDVAVFADGPWSHLFTGSFEENFIPHAMAYAACVGKGLTSCDN